MSGEGEKLWAAGPVYDAAARSYVPALVGGIAFVAAYYLAYRYGMAFSQAASSPFWFPDSVLLCALLKTRTRYWWLLVLATLPIRFFSEVSAGVPLWFLGACFANDALKGVVTALALRRFMRNPLRLDSVRDFAVFFAFAVVLVPVASAFAGATVRASIGHDYWMAFEQWFLGNATTQLVITPFILHWVFGGPWRMPEINRALEACLIAAGLVVASAFSFTTGETSVSLAEARLYAPVPFLFWAAIRFGMRGASGAIAVIALLAVDAALEGRGPFAGQSPNDTAFALQNFVLLRAVPLLLVAALTERSAAAERSLRESEGRFRDLANTTPMLLWMAGRDGRCSFVNQSYIAFTGRDLGQHIGTGWIKCVHADDIQQCLGTWTTATTARKRFESEFRLQRHDGVWRWVMSVGAPRYAEDGEFLGYIGSALDITDRKHIEDLGQTMGHVQRLAAMGELTAAIAHEVKQPLAAILANARAALNLLNNEAAPLQPVRDAITDILSDDLRANDVIDRVRAFARNQKPRVEAIELNAVVGDVVKLVAADARRRRIVIEAQPRAGLHPVAGDRTQLQQVLLNLIVNAMDAMVETPEGQRRVIVRTQLGGARDAEVRVIDNGPGIPPERQPYIFDSFFSTKADGMGLGLSVARSIVEAHRGRITAENNLSGGATFRFTVPLAA